MRDKITYQFPNFSGCAVKVWELISNFIAHFIMSVFDIFAVSYQDWQSWKGFCQHIFTEKSSMILSAAYTAVYESVAFHCTYTIKRLPGDAITIMWNSVLPIEVDTGHIKVIIMVTSEWGQWRLKSPASVSLAHPFLQAQIKENVKAPRHWLLWREPPMTGGFPS